MNERVFAFIDYLGISTSEFERLCGLSNGAVSKMGDNTRMSTLDRISKAYPQINVNWLRTGEGDMLLSSQSGPEEENFLSVQDKRMAKFVPLIPVEAQGGSLNDFVYSINQSDCEIIASPIKYVDFAIQVSGDSMAPEYPSGSYVYVKEINERAFIEWGKVYVLDTCNGSVIKVLTPSSREGYVRCISINTDPIYAPFEISLNDIRRVYRVMLCMSIK